MTPRCYTTAQLLAILALPRTTFFTLKAAHKLPFLEELKPRIGRCARYRADLVDRWLANQWGQPRAIAPVRRRA